LVDLTGATVGASFDLKAYNSNASVGSPLSNNYPGGEGQSSGQFGSLLNNSDFNVLHINVAAATSGAITTIPAKLTTNTFLADSNVTNTRTITLSGGPAIYYFNNDVYSATVFNQSVKLNAVEKWTITNTSNFSHTFHIHDVFFNIVSRTQNTTTTTGPGGGGPGGGAQGAATGIFAWEKGWKDTVYVQQGSSVSFIAKFDDYADSSWPFMYHCHFANHEDEGLMGSFVVVNNSVSALTRSNFMPVAANSDETPASWTSNTLAFDLPWNFSAAEGAKLLSSLNSGSRPATTQTLRIQSMKAFSIQ
jgi:bilirubin oxidase